MEASLQLTAEEERLAKNYAKRHSVPVREAFRQARFEKIKDEYDLAVFETAHREYLDDSETYSHSEVKEVLGV